VVIENAILLKKHPATVKACRSRTNDNNDTYTYDYQKDSWTQLSPAPSLYREPRAISHITQSRQLVWDGLRPQRQTDRDLRRRDG